MTCITASSHYLANASASDIVGWIQSLETAELGHSAMRQLQASNPAKANSVLCQMYDVACYKVGDSCFADTASPAEHDKWFVSIAAGDFDTDMTQVPPGASFAHAEAIAVERLQLQNLFFSAGEKERLLAA